MRQRELYKIGTQGRTGRIYKGLQLKHNIGQPQQAAEKC